MSARVEDEHNGESISGALVDLRWRGGLRYIDLATRHTASLIELHTLAPAQPGASARMWWLEMSVNRLLATLSPVSVAHLAVDLSHAYTSEGGCEHER